MFDIGLGEFLALAVIALIVLGPDKLPKFAADAARMVRTIRQMANNAREDVRRELGPEFQDIALEDLNPRTFVRKHVLDPDELRLDGDGNGQAPRRASSTSPSAARDELPPSAPPPYDPDAT
jgi:sec-independent protein translocase protein TatB